MTNPSPLATRYTPGQYSGMGATAAVNPATGGPGVPIGTGPYRGFGSMEELTAAQLKTRRSVDDKIRYGRPVSEEERLYAMRIGAISGGAPNPNPTIIRQESGSIFPADPR